MEKRGSERCDGDIYSHNLEIARIARMNKERELRERITYLEENGYVFYKLNNSWFKGSESIHQDTVRKASDEGFREIIQSNEYDLQRIDKWKECTHDIPKLESYNEYQPLQPFRNTCRKCGWVIPNYQPSSRKLKDNELTKLEIESIKMSLASGLLKKENVDDLYSIQDSHVRKFIEIIKLKKSFEIKRNTHNENWSYVSYKGKFISETTSPSVVRLGLFKTEVITKIRNNGVFVPLLYEEEQMYEMIALDQEISNERRVKGTTSPIGRTIFAAKTLEEVKMLFHKEFGE